LQEVTSQYASFMPDVSSYICYTHYDRCATLSNLHLPSLLCAYTCYGWQLIFFPFFARMINHLLYNKSNPQVVIRWMMNLKWKSMHTLWLPGHGR